MAELVDIARQKINDALGENSSKYFNNMKLWFRMKLTKVEFEVEVRALLNSEQMHLHNEFVRALLNKVKGLAETSLQIAQERAMSESRKLLRHTCSRHSESVYFKQADLSAYLPPNYEPSSGFDGVKYVARVLFFAKHGGSAAWDYLDEAEDDAADIIEVAAKTILKNILTAFVSQRKAYKIKYKDFICDFGGSEPNLCLRNTAQLHGPQEVRMIEEGCSNPAAPRHPPTVDQVEHAAGHEIACSVANEEPSGDKALFDEHFSSLP